MTHPHTAPLKLLALHYDEFQAAPTLRGHAEYLVHGGYVDVHGRYVDAALRDVLSDSENLRNSPTQSTANHRRRPRRA